MTHRPLVPACLLLAAMIVTGCAPTAKTAGPSQDYVFFPTPDPGQTVPPRLQFLVGFDRADFFARAQSRKTSFAQWVAGSEDESVTQPARIVSPYGIAADHGKLYVCDISQACVHVIDIPAGAYSRLDAPGKFMTPVNLTVGPDGTRYVCDTGRRVVLTFDAQDRFLREIGDPAKGVAMDLVVHGNELFVTDIRNKQVQVWDRDGKLLRTISREGQGPDELTMPTNLAIGPDNRLYVVDTFGQRVKVFDPAAGNYLDDIGRPGGQIGAFARPKGIAIDPDGDIWIADAQWSAVQAFNPKGELLAAFGSPGDQPWSMGIPATVLVDNTSLSSFTAYLAPFFKPEYLLFVVNQHGKSKVMVYAYGRDTRLPADAYEIDYAKVQAIRQARRQAAEEPSTTQPSATQPATSSP
ncbi:MAG: SMP-30/gluconolactonase/LRE family protein [Phycisphaeraceae bacterium]|nr:SMP-30/gluconolactonase/LRE family protein [Phycisphaeraceae bacterium]